MKVNKNILLLALMNAFAVLSHAQSDSLRREILARDDGKLTLINKGRDLLLERFAAGDKQKVADVFNYLLSLEDENYLAFCQPEKWCISYWIAEYDFILNDISNFSAPVYGRQPRITPGPDVLAMELAQALTTQRKAMHEQIGASDQSEMHKRFLVLNFDFLLTQFGQVESISQENLNAAATDYLTLYPGSPFEDYVKKYIRYELQPSKWAFAFEFFSGYGMFTDDLSAHFENNVPIGIDFDVYYKKFVLYLRDYIGFSHTKDSLTFRGNVWRNNSQARVFLPEATFGYVAFENNALLVAPFTGIGSTAVSPTDNDTEKYPEYDDVGLDFTTTYVFGVNIDVKLGQSRRAIVTNGPEHAYTFIRIRYGYALPQFNWKYTGYTGDFHYITIGIGGFGRKLKRKF